MKTWHMNTFTKDLPSRTKDGPRGATGIISFTIQNSKDKLLKAAKDKKSSLNGDIAVFRVRFEDPTLHEAHDKYQGYTKECSHITQSLEEHFLIEKLFSFATFYAIPSRPIQ